MIMPQRPGRIWLVIATASCTAGERRGECVTTDVPVLAVHLERDGHDQDRRRDEYSTVPHNDHRGAEERDQRPTDE